MGMTGQYEEGRGYGRLEYMVCRPENDFFPDLSKVLVFAPLQEPPKSCLDKD